MTPLPPVPGREHSPGPFVDPERLARLEERMSANGEDMRKLEEEQKRQHDSHEGLKRKVSDLDTATGRAIAKLSTEAAWIKWLLVFMVAIGVANGVIHFFGK